MYTYLISSGVTRERENIIRKSPPLLFVQRRETSSCSWCTVLFVHKSMYKNVLMGYLTMCILSVGSDASRTIRMCAAHGKADKCYERTGTKNIKLSYCTCEGDWCNSAPTLLGPRLIILSTISVILALISFL